MIFKPLNIKKNKKQTNIVQELEKQDQAAIIFIYVSIGCTVEREKTSTGKTRHWQGGGGGEIEAGGCWPWHNESYLLASDSVRDRDRVQTLDTSCSAS